MKKKLGILSLLVIFTLVSCLPMTAFATTVTTSGFYNVGTAQDVTITGLSEGENVTTLQAYINDDEVVDTVFDGSDGLCVTYASAVPGAYYAVTLVKGTALPTQTADFLFTEQKTAESATISFNVLPELPTTDTAMTLFITGNASGFQRIAIPVNYTPEGNFEAAATPLPGSVTITQGTTTLTAVLTGTPGEEHYDIVWTRNGNPISGANSLVYTINTSLDNNAILRVKLVAKESSPYSGEVVSTNHATISLGGGGGMSGGGGEATTYAVKTEATENGTVTVSAKAVAKGKTVKITATPNEGYKVSAVTVKDANGNSITVTEAEGVYSFEMPKAVVTVTVSFEEVKEEEPVEAVQFTDVAEDAYYYDAVAWAVSKNITQGMSETTFAPEAGCTRAQIITFLWRAAGMPKAENAENKFTDVAEGDYYYDAVLWAIEKGITSGVTETSFAPNASVDRAQTVTFMYRMAGEPAPVASDAFTDVAPTAYYNNAVNWAVNNDITKGTGVGTFSPASACTRGQIVTFIYRYLAE